MVVEVEAGVGAEKGAGVGAAAGRRAGNHLRWILSENLWGDFFMQEEVTEAPQPVATTAPATSATTIAATTSTTTVMTTTTPMSTTSTGWSHFIDVRLLHFCPTASEGITGIACCTAAQLAEIVLLIIGTFSPTIGEMSLFHHKRTQASAVLNKT